MSRTQLLGLFDPQHARFTGQCGFDRFAAMPIDDHTNGGFKAAGRA